MAQDPNHENAFVSTDNESLFYRVPSKIMSCIDGFPTYINQVTIDYDEDNDQVKFCATEDPFAQKRYTVNVPLDKVFKLLEEEGLTKDNFDDELFGIRNRYELITRAISRYVKKFF